MIDQTLGVAYQTGCHFFSYDAIVKMCFLAIRARKEENNLRALFIEGGFEEKLLDDIEYGANWFFENLSYLSKKERKRPIDIDIPAEWFGLIDEFWKRAYQIDLELSTSSKNRPYVFLCHSQKDKRFVRSLSSYLIQNDINVWLDESELLVGDSLLDRLCDAIDKVDYVIAVLSKASVNSNWVQTELKMAMTEEINSNQIKVLPLLKENCEFPKFLSQKFYADFSQPNRRKKAKDLLCQTIINSKKA